MYKLFKFWSIFLKKSKIENYWWWGKYINYSHNANFDFFKLKQQLVPIHFFNFSIFPCKCINFSIKTSKAISSKIFPTRNEFSPLANQFFCFEGQLSHSLCSSQSPVKHTYSTTKQFPYFFPNITHIFTNPKVFRLINPMTESHFKLSVWNSI